MNFSNGPVDDWQITENTPTLCQGLEFSDVVGLYPEALRVSSVHGTPCLTARNIAGQITLRSGRSLTIHPKYSSLDPIAMCLALGASALSIKSSEGFLRAADFVGLKAQDLHSKFAASLAAVSRLPKKFKRMPKTVRAAAISGRVDWKGSALNIALARRDPLVITRPVASYSLIENYVLSAAARRSLASGALTHAERSILQNWASLPIETSYSPEELRELLSMCLQRGLGGAHSFYTEPVILGLLIMGVGAAGSQRGEISSDGLLFNMPSLYEEFCRTMLSRRTVNLDLSVRKGFASFASFTTNGQYELIPDIVVYRGLEIRKVIDVKYKEPDAKDIYQLFTYMHFAELHEAYIITPSIQEPAAVETFDGRRIRFVHLASTSSNDLSLALDQLIDRF